MSQTNYKTKWVQKEKKSNIDILTFSYLILDKTEYGY